MQSRSTRSAAALLRSRRVSRLRLRLETGDQDALAHQPLDPFFADPDVVTEPQRGVHPGRAVGLPALGLDAITKSSDRALADAPAYRFPLVVAESREFDPHPGCGIEFPVSELMVSPL